MTVVAITLASLTLATSTLDPHERGGAHQRVVGHGQIKFDGAGPERWALRFRKEHKLVEQLRTRLHQTRRTLLSAPTVSEAINLAGATYGYTPVLWRKARCESGFNRFARNPSGAAGLFQFLPSTWRSTPYGDFSIYDPFAQALAAGWMHAHGRGGEWVCQ